MTSVTVEEVVRRALTLVKPALNRSIENVVEINREASNWRIVLEALERKAVPDSQDTLGRYEVKMNELGELISLRQLKIRHRGDLL